jgi:acyl-CoA dehydrogenase
MAIYESDHDLAIFRQALQRFLQNEIVPHIDDWEKAGITPRWAWRKMGEQGYLFNNSTQPLAEYVPPAL